MNFYIDAGRYSDELTEFWFFVFYSHDSDKLI